MARVASAGKLNGMGKPVGAGHYASLQEKLESAIALLKTEDVGAGAAKVKLNLRYAMGALKRMKPMPAAGNRVISLEDVCRFLRIRGEGLHEKELERAVALPHRILVQLERAAGMQSNLDQLQYALAGAMAALPRGSGAKRLLTAAAGVGKKLALQFALTPDVPAIETDGIHLRLEDACRAVEQVFRFTSAEDAVRATGVPLAMVKRMDSAAAFAGKRDG